MHPFHFAIQSSCSQSTEKIAASLAKHLKAPVLIALKGDLGAGKTCFSRGFVRALNPNAQVSSPTYALAHTHSPAIYHIDLYRAQGQDLEDLGIQDMLDDPEAIKLVEWPPDSILDTQSSWVQISFCHPALDAGSIGLRTLNFRFSSNFSESDLLTLQKSLLDSLLTAG